MTFDAQEGTILVDDDTAEASITFDSESKATGVSSIVLENIDSAGRHDCGVWLNTATVNAPETWFYAYSFQYAAAYASLGLAN